MVKKHQQTEEWLIEFINKFNMIMINTATVNNMILKLAEQLDTVYIMMGTLKITVSKLLENELNITEEEFNDTFLKIYKEIMSGKTNLQDDYLKSVKDLMQQHHELVENDRVVQKQSKNSGGIEKNDAEGYSH